MKPLEKKMAREKFELTDEMVINELKRLDKESEYPLTVYYWAENAKWSITTIKSRWPDRIFSDWKILAGIRASKKHKKPRGVKKGNHAKNNNYEKKLAPATKKVKCQCGEGFESFVDFKGSAINRFCVKCKAVWEREGGFNV